MNRPGLDAFVPWLIGLAIVVLFVPVSLGLLNRAYLISQQRADEFAYAKQETESRYGLLWDQVPASLWELDGSDMRAWFVELTYDGVTDLRDRLESEHPDAETIGQLVRVRNVNQRSVDLLEAGEMATLVGR